MELILTSCLKRNVNVYTEATPECATYVKLDTHTHTHTPLVDIMLRLSWLIHVTHMHTHMYSYSHVNVVCDMFMATCRPPNYIVLPFNSWRMLKTVIPI